MLYQNYIFDLYGTLVDVHTDESRPEFWDKIADRYQAKGAHWIAGELRVAYGEACRRETLTAARRLPPEQQALAEPELRNVFRDLYRQKGVSPDDTLLDREAWEFRRLSTEKLRLFPGAKELLIGLKERGSKIYLLTNAQACFTRKELDILGLQELFDGIVISSEEGAKKPSPLFFRRCMGRYGLEPARTVMVGNDHLADCAGAWALGMDSRYIFTEQSPPRPAQLPPHCQEIHTLLELLIG